MGYDRPSLITLYLLALANSMREYSVRSLTPLGQIDRDGHLMQDLLMAYLVSIPLLTVFSASRFFDCDIAVFSPSVAAILNPYSEIRFLTEPKCSAAFAERIGKRGVRKQRVRVNAILDFTIPPAERRQISVSFVFTSSLMSTHQPCGGGSVQALLFLARVAHYCAPSERSETSESWLQCDACFRWRRGIALPPDSDLCRRWTCPDSGRRCQEPCDHCLSKDCNCMMSQSYSGYSTGGYSLPQGFSVVIRFRHAPGREVGRPWLSYRSRCDVCGEASRGMDRRDYLQRWLENHQGHNAKWKDLTVDAFDFKVDQRVRDWYAVYVRLLERGILEGGIRCAIRSASPLITDEEKEMMTSLMEVVDASRFFEEVAFSESALTKPRPIKRAKKDTTSDSKALGNAAVPEKRAIRKARKPIWMRHSDQWVIDGMKETTCTEEEFVPHVSWEGKGEMPFPIVTNRSVDREVADLVEQAELILAERLICGNVTKRKDKQSLICDVAERDVTQQLHRTNERVGSGRVDSVVWVHRGQMGDLVDGSRSPQIDIQPREGVDGRLTQAPSVRYSQLFSLSARHPGASLLLAKRKRNGDDHVYSTCNAERDARPAAPPFSILSRWMPARRDSVNGQ